MRYREWDLSDVTFGNAQVAILYKDNEIERFDIPIANFGEKYFDSINADVGHFEYNGLDFEITIASSNVGVNISIELLSDKNSSILNDFDINIMFDEEINELENLNMSYYVPVVPYTTTMSSAFYGIADNAKVVPMYDIENESKLSSYKEDDLLDFMHYLDISSIQYVVNKGDYNEIKAQRKKEKKETGAMITPYPELIQKTRSIIEKIQILKSLENKKLIIPVFLWDTDSTLKELTSFREKLKDEFKNFAIRIYSNQLQFIENIEEVEHKENIHILMDMDTNYNIKDIKNFIDKYDHHGFKKIIYLGAQFKPNNISISRDNTNYNHVLPNQTLLTFEAIQKDKSIIGYGDYCGFDRKTLSEMPKGGRPSARVVLCSLDKTKQILIRRGWDDRDKKIIKGRESIGAIHSMERLLCDIKNGLLDKVSNSVFMNTNLCDADAALKSFCPKREKAGIIKTLCIRHNIGSIKHFYLQ